MLETRDAQDTAARRDAQDMAAGRECGRCTSCPMRMGLGVPSRHPLPSKTAAARAWSCGSILSNSSMQHMPLSASINAPASMQNSPVSSSLLTCRAAGVKKGRSGGPHWRGPAQRARRGSLNWAGIGRAAPHNTAASARKTPKCKGGLALCSPPKGVEHEARAVPWGCSPFWPGDYKDFLAEVCLLDPERGHRPLGRARSLWR